MFISLIRDHPTGIDHVAALSWVPNAVLGDAHPAGVVADGLDRSRGGVVFVVSRLAPAGADVVACHACDMPEGPTLLRVDEVCFPVGAVAHRHTHTGAGIRHFVRGSLRIEADDHTQIMTPGDSWFEGAGSPVRAVALHDHGVTSFVRAMVIPAAYEGKSTFALMDPADADLPRLQVTHRHIDLPFQVDAG